MAKKKNLRIEIENNFDVIVSLQVSPTSVVGVDGEREGEPEAVLVMESTEDENSSIATFTTDQLGKFIKHLESVKWILDKADKIITAGFSRKAIRLVTRKFCIILTWFSGHREVSPICINLICN